MAMRFIPSRVLKSVDEVDRTSQDTERFSKEYKALLWRLTELHGFIVKFDDISHEGGHRILYRVTFPEQGRFKGWDSDNSEIVGVPFGEDVWEWLVRDMALPDFSDLHYAVQLAREMPLALYIDTMTEFYRDPSVQRILERWLDWKQ